MILTLSQVCHSVENEYFAYEGLQNLMLTQTLKNYQQGHIAVSFHCPILVYNARQLFSVVLFNFKKQKPKNSNTGSNFIILTKQTHRLTCHITITYCYKLWFHVAN